MYMCALPYEISYFPATCRMLHPSLYFRAHLSISSCGGFGLTNGYLPCCRSYFNFSRMTEMVSSIWALDGGISLFQ